MRKILLFAFLLVGISAFAQSNPTHSVTNTCTPATSGTVATGFNFYRGTVSGGPYTKITPTPQSTCANTDASVANGTTYYYVATGVNAGGESVFSNESSAVIPQIAAPAAPTGLASKVN